MKPSARVAVTGIGFISALGSEPNRVISAMREGRSGARPLTRFPHQHFVDGIAAEADDAVVGKYCSHQERSRFDISALFGLAAGRMALEDSGLDRNRSTLMGLGLGTCNGGIHSLERQWTLSGLDPERTREYPFYRQGDVIAQQLGLTGPVLTVNTACTAGATAMGWAYDMVRVGAAEAMLAGGSDPLSLVVYAGFHVLRALSPKSCTPYGVQTGLTLGEGAAFVVLEPWDEAIARKAHIYAEILGYGLSNDGYHATASDPQGRGVETAVRIALEGLAGKDRAMDYINTHGTGTKANDVPELQGLRQVFGDGLSKIPVSSSKGYFGHALGAAGMIEYVTTAIALKSGIVPTIPTGPLREGTEGVWLVNDSSPKEPLTTFLSTNSAFGGHNCAVVSRVMRDSKLEPEDRAPKRADRAVVITGLGFVGALGPVQGSILRAWSERGRSQLGPPFSLKEFEPELYERRMNVLTQLSVAAAKLALDDAGWQVSETVSREIGVLFGTARGSLASTARYLDSIYRNGPALASSIDFPNMVLNSTLGKISEKLKLRGFSSSISTGGNEGLMALTWGYESIVGGQQARCLVGAGDEGSPLQSAIDGAEGVNRSQFQMSEGAAFVALADAAWVAQHSSRRYARVLAWAASYGIDALVRSGRNALQKLAGERSVDLILLSSLGRPGELESARRALSSLSDAPIHCLVDKLGGYGLSHTALTHLALAASLFDESLRLTEETFHWGIGTVPERILVVSGSIYDNAVAVILGNPDNDDDSQRKGG